MEPSWRARSRGCSSVCPTPSGAATILETFVDRGQLRKLAEPTITSTGKRIPGLKLDHPRQLALMHALVRFAHVAADNTFTTAEIYPAVIKALGCVPDS